MKPNHMDDLKNALDSAIRQYETAIMQTKTDEDEIRCAVDRCAVARQRFNDAKEELR